ncbi:MAG: multicopper oxidase family protein [Bacteroidales bacterium]
MKKTKLKQITRVLILLVIIPLFAFCNNSKQQKRSSNQFTITDSFEPDIDISLTATPAEIQLLEGEKTAVYTYTSELIKGDSSSLQQIPNSYLGPIIRVKPNQKIRIRYNNELPDESIIHWHGLHVPEEMDGHPRYVINNGEQFVYEFVVNNRPGTYWFHPHPHGITGYQVYKGLAGMFIIEDNQSNLPSDKYEVPLVIQDRRFDSSNQLVYLENNMMDMMVGFLGNEILINGKSNSSMEVDKATYRFRVLNGSNSRIYKLAWSDGVNLTVIGNDGGLLSKPTEKPYIILGPGERIDVWRDLSNINSGEQIALNSLAFNSGTSMGMMGSGGGMGGGMMRGRGNMQRDNNLSDSYIDNGDALTLYNFIVSDKQGEVVSLPTEFEPIEQFDLSESVNQDSPRQFNFHFERMQWLINGKTFEMNEVADWEKVKLNTTEVWEFINGGSGGGMMGNMMSMPHPVHIHGLQFQIIERDVSEVPTAVWNSMKDGFIDEGWQDTFLLLSGMRVKVALRFEDFTGIFLYHCHNLEHEDMGMMRNYEVIE